MLCTYKENYIDGNHHILVSILDPYEFGNSANVKQFLRQVLGARGPPPVCSCHSVRGTTGRLTSNRAATCRSWLVSLIYEWLFWGYGVKSPGQLPVTHRYPL